MAVTAGRASATYQDIADTYETLFESASHGSACRGFLVKADATAAALIKVTNVHNYGAGGATLSEYLLDAGEERTFYANAISKVEAKEASAGAGAKLKWSVIIA